MLTVCRLPRRWCYFLALPLSIFFSIPSMADDISFWEKPYIGAYVGHGFSSNQISTDAGIVTDTSYFSSSTDINAINAVGSYSQNSDRTIIGIETGQDWVWKKIVYGVGLDYDLLPFSISKNVTTTYPDGYTPYSIYTATNARLLSLRGRLGYPVSLPRPALLYMTGGLGIAQITVTNSFNDSTATGDSQTTARRFGWTGGVGLELPLIQHMSMNLEYSYFDVPSSIKTTSYVSNEDGFGVPAGSLTSPFSTTEKFHANLLKLGIKYRF